ncbi:Probable hydrolase [Moritella viscosa]|uniref:alpha/beta fold hydrolase n=1 Tax=Moritella viscosa TaxID=80854 RepID=UPI0009211981|nr:alpha/beta hydrolase [Moritella viscosa]SGZ05710.1 Probable hydrolase [Moritella viscosa]
MKEFTVKSCNATLRYHDLPGTGIPIVFIHGIGCTSSFDYPQVASMGGVSQHRRIILDLLGSGFSDKPDDFDYTIASHASYIEDLINSLGLNELVIFGHSMGGAVSIALASRLESKLKALILSEGNLDSGGGFFSQKIATYSEDNYRAFGHNDIINESLATSNTEWATCLRMSSPHAVHREAVSLIEGQNPSWRQTFYSLNTTKTYIFGSETLPDPDYQELKSNNINIGIVERAGHSMAWENPKGLAAAIMQAIPAS